MPHQAHLLTAAMKKLLKEKIVMTWQIWFACAVIVLVVIGLARKMETRMLLLAGGLLMCAVSGDPMKAFTAFTKGMIHPTLVPSICTAMGFAAVISASKCDEHLVAMMAAPLKVLGGLLIPVTMLLTFGINIAIMSAAGTAACAGATFIPLLLRAGIRPAAAAASVGGGTMCGLMLNPGCAHDIYVAKISGMPLIDYIGHIAIYVVGLVVLATVVNSAIMLLKNKDHRMSAEEIASLKIEEKAQIRVNPLKAVAPLIPLAILLVGQIFFPKARIDVVFAMLCGMAAVALICWVNPGEVTKPFFKGMGQGFASVIGLIVAAGVFVAGLHATGAIPAFIGALKSNPDFARWGGAIGPFLLAVGTGSGEAAIWAFNQAVTPSAAQFGMNPADLGTLAILAGQFGRTASPLAGCIIIVAGLAGADPFQVAKRLLPGMVVALIAAALIVV
jgi:DcuC family C4-dicarboxylate transporter